MRIRHSLKALIPVIMMLVSERTVLAQGGPPMPAAGMPMAGAQQVPGSYGMYPYQSPYQGMFEQTYQRDGTWFQNSQNGFGPNNRPRNWFMNLDYTKTINRRMSGLVGADGVQSYFQQIDPASNDISPGLSSFRLFDAATASIIPQLRTNGIKLSGGFWNPDGSGFLYEAGYSFQNTSEFNARAIELEHRLDTATVLYLQRNQGRGDHQPFNLGGRTDLDITTNNILAPGVTFDSTDAVTYGVFGSTFDVLNRTLMNLYGLPTTSDNPIQGTNGQTAPYDLEFILRQSISTGGAAAAWAYSPIYEKDSLKVRPIVGGRYFRIDETFRFDGSSALLGYADNGDGDTPANAQVYGPGDGRDQNNNFILGDPNDPGDVTFVPITFLSGDPTHLIVNSYINSNVVSSLAGPELGFQYEVGATKGMQITGSTRVAAMFNTERLKLRGDNIGNPTGIEDPTTGDVTTTMFDTNSTNGLTLNAFSDTASSTHLSPLFQQSLNAKIPIFGRVPVLKDMWQLEDASLNLGWTFQVIGRVADPNDSIVYDSSPVQGRYLHYQVERNTFTQNTFNIGVNWNY